MRVKKVGDNLHLTLNCAGAVDPPHFTSTSIVKSTWPGVSIMLMWWPPHSQNVAADCIVMPFSRSRSMESIFAPTPSCRGFDCFDWRSRKVKIASFCSHAWYLVNIGIIYPVPPTTVPFKRVQHIQYMYWLTSSPNTPTGQNIHTSFYKSMTSILCSWSDRSCCRCVTYLSSHVVYWVDPPRVVQNSLG